MKIKGLFVALLAMCSSTMMAQNEISVDPFAIGPGVTTTIKVKLTNTSTNITKIQFDIKLPTGVRVQGVDESKASVMLKKGTDFYFNPSRSNGSGTANMAWAKREGTYGFNCTLDDPIGGTSGDWFLAFNVECDEGVTANPSAQITWGTVKVGEQGVTSEAITPSDVDVQVSDKFIAPCNADGYCTICPTIGLDLSGVDAYIVTKVNDASVSLTKITELAAGDAAIVKGSGNVEIPLKSGAATSATGNLLEGVQKYTDTTGKAEFFLVGDAFVPAAATSHLAAGRAYLTNTGASAKVLSLSFDDDATAIQNVEAEKNNGVLYNLNGVRVDNAVKGVYIQNGRKVVIK